MAQLVPIGTEGATSTHPGRSCSGGVLWLWRRPPGVGWLWRRRYMTRPGSVADDVHEQRDERQRAEDDEDDEEDGIHVNTVATCAAVETDRAP